MAAACGRGFTLLVTEDGNMAPFGLNSHAQLGCGNIESHGLPIFTRGRACFDGQEFVMVAAGEEHSACVSMRGVLWTWGNAMYGRLGTNFSTESSVETRELAAERRRELDMIMWPWNADILSKSAFILGDVYDNTTQYARKYGFTRSIDISLGP